MTGPAATARLPFTRFEPVVSYAQSGRVTHHESMSLVCVTTACKDNREEDRLRLVR